jgi:hypothetical protein
MAALRKRRGIHRLSHTIQSLPQQIIADRNLQRRPCIFNPAAQSNALDIVIRHQKNSVFTESDHFCFYSTYCRI